MFDVVLSGDPQRKTLFKRLTKLYHSYASVSNVFLFYERNPAVAFNRGARLSLSDKLFFTCDCYVSESVMKQMVALCNGNIIYAQTSTKRDGLFDVGVKAFTSGAFAVARNNILMNPIPEHPDYCEEIIWLKTCPLQFIPYFTKPENFIHLHKHTFNHIFKFARWRTQHRASLKNRKWRRHLYLFINLYEALFAWLREPPKFNPSTELTKIEADYKNGEKIEKCLKLKRIK